MEKERSTKLIAIVALVVGCVCLSFGFAAFSNILNISSNAAVSPDSATFGVEFSNGSDLHDGDGTLNGTGVNGAVPGIIRIQGSAISMLSPGFTEPGQSAIYDFYVENIGEYDAYLRSVNFENVSGEDTFKSCIETGDNPATADLAAAACDDINVKIQVGSDIYTGPTSSITGHKLAKGELIPVSVTIEYAADGNRADGAFRVLFGKISLEYSTADSTV